MLTFEHFMELLDNPKVNEPVTDFCQMIPLEVYGSQATKYLKILARFDFEQGHVNAITALPPKYALYCPKSFYNEIIVNGTDDLSNSNSHFKNIEVMANAVTSDER